MPNDGLLALVEAAHMQLDEDEPADDAAASAPRKRQRRGERPLTDKQVMKTNYKCQVRKIRV
jgi:hypothetical protein